ncbi:triose-phosphate isomerase [Glaciecola siphonariae]|uniref:Triosephosphate isomerase n=1 Tax=Glaciecola siphonariae TaxID=521012 RepID=A0ABV9LRF9_9ALTE
MSTERKYMVAGNWKMNGNRALVDDFKKNLAVPSAVDVLICPPAPYLSLFDGAEFLVGAQTISEFEKGAHTGDVSASMLADLGVNHVILGHSERRQDHGESNEQVAAKVKLALDSGLTPILCVGEPLSVREAGEVNAYVQQQIDAVLDVCGDRFFDKAVIAYEPIWAIGTGKTASPEQAQDVHAFIRAHLLKSSSAAQQMRILYGGSVNAQNAKELFAQADIDGGLIGGASLKVDDFNIICQAAS